MKKLISIAAILILVAFSGCTSNRNTNQSGAERSISEQQSRANQDSVAGSGATTETDLTIVSSDIILDVEDIQEVSGQTFVSGTLKSDAFVGMGVQLVGVGQKPVTLALKDIQLNGNPTDKAQAGQKVSLVFDANKAPLEKMQRVVAAKLKKESELKPVEVFEDVLGTIDSIIYTNGCFGFTISTADTGYNMELSSQEGYRVSFESPPSFQDIVPLRISSEDYSAMITLNVTNLEAMTEKNAEAHVAERYIQYNVTPEQLLLGDKEVSYIQYKNGEDTTDVYAMIVNGYYIEFNVLNKAPGNQDSLNKIMDTIQFHWVKE